MGIEDYKAKKSLSATRSEGIEQALDYLEKTEIPPPTTKDSKSSKLKPRYIPLELQRLFSELQLLDKIAISTEGKHITIILSLTKLFKYSIILI